MTLPQRSACPPEPPTPAEAYSLIRAEGSELLALMLRASELRDRHKGRLVTYSRKVFIPLTNLCRDKCGYCTFARPPGDAKAKTMTPDEVLAVARARRERGCKEALFSLGEKPEKVHALAREHLRDLGYGSTVEYLAAMCGLVFAETGLIPHVNCGVLTRDELLVLREHSGSALWATQPELIELLTTLGDPAPRLFGAK